METPSHISSHCIPINEEIQQYFGRITAKKSKKDQNDKTKLIGIKGNSETGDKGERERS